MKPPCYLDGAFDGFGTRIGEEHGVRETRLDQPLCQPLLRRDTIEIRSVPELAGLFAQSCDQLRVRVTQRRNCDARPEVEVALALLVEEIRPFATFKSDVRPVVGRKKRRN